MRGFRTNVLEEIRDARAFLKHPITKSILEKRNTLMGEDDELTKDEALAQALKERKVLLERFWPD